MAKGVFVNSLPQMIMTTAAIDLLKAFLFSLLFALLGCKSAKDHEHSRSMEAGPQKKEIVTQETLRLTTLLNDTIYLKDEKLIIHFDTIHHVLYIKQVQPVAILSDSIIYGWEESLTIYFGKFYQILRIKRILSVVMMPDSIVCGQRVWVSSPIVSKKNSGRCASCKECIDKWGGWIFLAGCFFAFFLFLVTPKF